jgi:hypothetical protein
VKCLCKHYIPFGAIKCKLKEFAKSKFCFVDLSAQKCFWKVWNCGKAVSVQNKSLLTFISHLSRKHVVSHLWLWNANSKNLKNQNFALSIIPKVRVLKGVENSGKAVLSKKQSLLTFISHLSKHVVSHLWAMKVQNPKNLQNQNFGFIDLSAQKCSERCWKLWDVSVQNKVLVNLSSVNCPPKHCCIPMVAAMKCKPKEFTKNQNFWFCRSYVFRFWKVWKFWQSCFRYKIKSLLTFISHLSQTCCISMVVIWMQTQRPKIKILFCRS